MPSKLITGAEAKAFSRHAKWVLLSPHLSRHGREALAYSTLQDGLEYFIDDCGYLAFITVKHPVLARKTRRIVLSDPICAITDYEKLIKAFLADHPYVAFVVVSETCA